ncbi:MAG: hypothetical protein AB9888_00175 [Bacteroidales bacterium]
MDTFDWKGITIIMAGLSLGGIGMIMAGYFLFPETAQKYKREIPTVILGMVLVAIASTIISAFGG